MGAKKPSGECHYLFQRQLERLWRCVEQDLAPAWVRAGYDWHSDRPAVRHGFFAAFRWAWLDTWTLELEALLEREWMGHASELEWDDVSYLVRHGWNEGRRHVSGYPHASRGEEEWTGRSEELGA